MQLAISEVVAGTHPRNDTRIILQLVYEKLELSTKLDLLLLVREDVDFRTIVFFRLCLEGTEGWHVLDDEEP